jgi:hypothetical protein
MPAFKDITGQVFARLKVIKPTEKRSCGNVVWLCECDCGNIVAVSGVNLRNHTLKSCGCYLIDWLRETNTKHGHASHGKPTPELQAYKNARNRCNNPNVDSYEWYGGRGIKFLFPSFEEFYVELGDKPEPKHLYSVDRIDTNSHYMVGNVRWATDEQQVNNKRRRRAA